ncbi:DUF3892 domain-containing protein [Agromyces sp. ISL-38]|uniref:DUF3892 domain-containing protein n=1 Tax=Agromyces sp. ISL-38 TaxID=2819107 RepID=UPI001BE59CEB|nr:DUF3892 domain-containing protein [Agromyces sp. ISL-38]MBT2500102.1 DUF3892 domain-containing protein [Agromyces sp. ISL-38]
MPYIRRVRVQSPGTRSEHITAVQYSATTTGALTVATTDAMVRAIDSGTTVYTSHDLTQAKALVIARNGMSGRRHLTTVANGRETDNLLQLPRF